MIVDFQLIFPIQYTKSTTNNIVLPLFLVALKLLKHCNFLVQSLKVYNHICFITSSTSYTSTADLEFPSMKSARLDSSSSKPFWKEAFFPLVTELKNAIAIYVLPFPGALELCKHYLNPKSHNKLPILTNLILTNAMAFF